MTDEAIAAKIGVVPRISATVVADPELQGVDERELVDEQEDRGGADQQQVAPAADRERPLQGKRDGGGEQRGRPVADRAVGQRAKAVREHVLRDRDVEGPDHDRRDQHQVDMRGRRIAAPSQAYGGERLRFRTCATPRSRRSMPSSGPRRPISRTRSARGSKSSSKASPRTTPSRRYAEEKMDLLDRLGHASSKAEEGARVSPAAGRAGPRSRARPRASIPLPSRR